MNVQEVVKTYIATYGPIPTVRVSSAYTSRYAGLWPYWGRADYQICILKDGALSNVFVKDAKSDRRSYRLAWEDCKKTGRLLMQNVGILSDSDVASVFNYIMGPQE